MFEGLFIIIWTLLYEACSLLTWLMQCIYETFEVFAGLRMVRYNGEDKFLIDVFFGNDAVSRIYWGMATIGIVLCFAFTIIAVIRKMFDSEDKMQTTIGRIVGNMIKSILMILMMNFLMTVIISVTNVVLQQVDYVFGGGYYNMGTEGKEIVYTEEDFATMARIYNTIGNYALNASYDSRLNINSCFNEIRNDMLLLDKKDYFEYDYDYDANGELGVSWQSVLVPIARARSLKTDINIDEYDTGLVEAMIQAMEVLQSGAEFRPLQVYSVPPVATVDEDTRLDTIVMLTGTMSASENEKYNQNPSIFDALREPYLSGEKDIHDIQTFEVDFDLSAVDYLLIIICAVFLGYQMIFLAINAIARIFNMLLLYFAFPPIMAASPLDDGGKRKQWTTAFIVQCLTVFGAVMAMRLVTFCVPIIYSDSLNLFPDSALSGPRNYIVKLFFLIAVAFTANKSIGMISGILADSAGYQSMTASNIGDSVVSDIKAGYANAKGVANFITGKGDKDKDKNKNKGKQQENKGNTGSKDSGSKAKTSSSGGGGGGQGTTPTNHSQLGGGTDEVNKTPEANDNPNSTQLQNNSTMSTGTDNENTQTTQNTQGTQTEPQNLNSNLGNDMGNTQNNENTQTTQNTQANPTTQNLQGTQTVPQNLNNNQGNDAGNKQNNQNTQANPTTQNLQGTQTAPQNLNNDVGNAGDNHVDNHVGNVGGNQMGGGQNTNNNGRNVVAGNTNIGNTNNQEVNRGTQQINSPQNNVTNQQEGGNTNRQNVTNEPPLKQPPRNLHDMLQ